MITPEVLELFVELEHAYNIHKARRLAFRLDLFSEWFRSYVSVNDKGSEALFSKTAAQNRAISSYLPRREH